MAVSKGLAGMEIGEPRGLMVQGIGEAQFVGSGNDVWRWWWCFPCIVCKTIQRLGCTPCTIDG